MNPRDGWSPDGELTNGELRQLCFHLETASARLAKAEALLGESDADTVDEDRLSELTQTAVRLHMAAERAYTAQRRNSYQPTALGGQK